MAKLSVIIVNYNVKYFLEQALQSVLQASATVDTEVIVVDNASVDGSVEMVREEFPQVKLIANKINTGFSKANNQGIAIATGEYILLLNPDTIVQEDTFEKVISYMDAHPEAGALGVKMLDGRGNYLPESKRGLPTPKVSFFKITGLTSLFPKSKLFAGYYLGHLNENETHEVEVLAGAFMLLRKSALDEAGWLDETFFMYGEDIDLSYRISQAGYKVIYFPETQIIHYKGESTKKGSLNYVKMFYQAMAIFAKKHFSSGKASFYSGLIHSAIYLKAATAVFQRFFKNFFLLILDVLLFFGGLFLIKEFWANNIKNAPEYYPEEFMLLVVPLYIFIWTLSIYFSGGYDQPFRIWKNVRGVLVGTVFILAIYGLLNESYRFSRAIIILGAAWGVVEVVASRMLYHLWKWGTISISEKKNRFVIAGAGAEGARVLHLVRQIGRAGDFVGFVTPENKIVAAREEVGTINELPEITALYDIDEVIFCSKDLSFKQIIELMQQLGPQLEYKTVAKDSLSIIGSNSKNTAGDLYAADLNLAISSPEQKRNKRVLDLLTCFFLLITFPVHLLLVKDLKGLTKNWWQVLKGNRTWVGYAAERRTPAKLHLPKIRQGILAPSDILPGKNLNEYMLERLNLLYAKDYSTAKDLQIIWKGYNQLGRQQTRQDPLILKN